MAFRYFHGFDFFDETGDVSGLILDRGQFDADVFFPVRGVMHMKDAFGFAGTPAFGKGARFAGAVTGRFVIMGDLVTGTSDNGRLRIAVFPESAVDGNDPVFPVEKDVRFGLRLQKRADFGKWHGVRSRYG